MSISTARGWWNAPTMFLPSGWLTPVLPPTDESTCASSVVGTWTKGMPRWQIAAAKPAMSPTTPPPSAITVVERSARSSSSRVSTSCSVAQVLCVSPSGISTASLAMPAAARLSRSGASQCAATTGLVTITARGAASSGASRAPASRSRPAPMWTG